MHVLRTKFRLEIGTNKDKAKPTKKNYYSESKIKKVIIPGCTDLQLYLLGFVFGKVSTVTMCIPQAVHLNVIN